MADDWQKLTELTGKRDIFITSVKIVGSGITISGEFDLPPMAQLSSDDQVFAAAFIRSHGSIKQMEKMFGVSYPTIKSRLNAIGAKLDFVEIGPVIEEEPSGDILEAIDQGEMSVEEALEILKKRR